MADGRMRLNAAIFVVDRDTAHLGADLPPPAEWERYSFCVRILEVFLVVSLFSGVEIGNKHRF